MGTITRIRPILVASALGIGLGLWAEQADAGDHGHFHHRTTYQTASVVGTPVMVTAVPTTAMVTSVPVAHMAMVSAVPTVPVATHFMVAAAAPTYTYYTQASVGVIPLASLPTQGATANPMLAAAGASAGASSSQATVDYLPLYNQFLQLENQTYPGSASVAAGLRTNPADLAVFSQKYPQLVAAVGGADRLGSLGRFLLSKITDPNFDSNALKLFEPILQTFVPGFSNFSPLILSFLNDLKQGSGSGPLKPLQPITPPSGIPAAGGSFNATGSFPGVINLTPVTGPTPPPGSNVPSPAGSGLKDDGSGGKLAPAS